MTREIALLCRSAVAQLRDRAACAAEGQDSHFDAAARAARAEAAGPQRTP